jgi:hypothetical protein
MLIMISISITTHTNTMSHLPLSFASSYLCLYRPVCLPVCLCLCLVCSLSPPNSTSISPYLYLLQVCQEHGSFTVSLQAAAAMQTSERLRRRNGHVIVHILELQQVRTVPWVGLSSSAHPESADLRWSMVLGVKCLTPHPPPYPGCDQAGVW